LSHGSLDLQITRFFLFTPSSDHLITRRVYGNAYAAEPACCFLCSN
jgi:hypothetical protein